jgi:hypothetical protein
MKGTMSNMKAAGDKRKEAMKILCLQMLINDLPHNFFDIWSNRRQTQEFSKINLVVWLVQGIK